ncbi:VWA domain-containing protein [Jiella pacifica]|uniref:VWA domain-containing protein n=1 Tax=Jiella pacifica TaxID=2696469 RepID=A0A6N9SXR7_9HYPH|nr:pilus assembly protein [Jiella pacifica]NDW03880.1 VWA domain-containing protein [Jiella pacifica]
MTLRQNGMGSRRGVLGAMRRLAKADAGNFGIILGLSAVPLIVAIGGAIDYSNALREKAGVQAAADAAALSAAKFSGTDEKARTARADMFFKANLDAEIDIKSTSLKKVDGSWVYDASFSMPTTFLGLMDVKKLDMSVQSAVKQSDTPLDIVLVLDSTGSMQNYGKMAQLQAAVQLFLDNFEDAAGAAKIQVAMIPFDTQIKIQNASMTMLATPKAQCDYLSSPDKANCKDDEKGFLLGTSKTYQLGKDSSSKRYIQYVYEAKDTPGQVLTVTRRTDSCPSASYKKCSSSTSTIYSRSITKTKVTGSYSGCILDRFQPYDTQSDAAVSSSVDTLYTRAAECSGTLQPVVALTENFDTLRTAVKALKPSGNTNIAIGVQWGMEALEGASPLVGANIDGRTKKIMVVLTDGDNTEDRWYDSSNASQIDDRTEIACGNAKAMKNPDGTDLELYSIRVIDGNETLLKQCATDEGHYYSVKNANELSSVFQDIAERVKKLRIVS